jgi:DNA-binding NarL/FixJ family response regulator
MKTAAVIDEWSLVRVGVETTLRRRGLTVAVATATATEFFGRALTATGASRIDLVVIGSLADMTTIAAVRRAAQAAGLSVIVMTGTASPASVLDLCADGARAVVGRDGADSELALAIQSVMDGNRYVSSDLLSAMFDAKQPVPGRPDFDLTIREREVLAELVAGKTNTEISQRLSIGSETVKTHLNHIYDKLDVRRRTHAVRVAVQHGLV